MNEQAKMPGYLVISQRDQAIMMATGVNVTRLVRVIPCDLADYKAVWDWYLSEYVSATGYNAFEAQFFAREPENAIRDMAKRESKESEGRDG